MKEKPEIPSAGWHRWFGNFFKEAPLDVEVYTDFPVMTDPPRADIVIIRKTQNEWTLEQSLFLPDGVRESKGP